MNSVPSLQNRESEKDVRQGFTLIELLVVIAVVAILAIVVVLVLNPSQLLKQGRDSQRLADLSTLNTAITISQSAGLSLGSSSVVYVSIPDSSPTCANLGLPGLSSGSSYACAPSSTYHNADGTGWIPINVSLKIIGSPLNILPIDPVNTTSTNLYYTYATNGTGWMVTAIPESQKEIQILQTSAQIPGYAGVMAAGSNLTVSPIYSYNSSLAGWWTLNEGVGSTTLDSSGGGSSGTWGGTPAGNGGTYYIGGNNQTYSGNFNGSNDNISVANTSTFDMASGATFSGSAWIRPTAINATYIGIMSQGTGGTSFNWTFNINPSQQLIIGNTGGWASQGSSITIPLNTWSFVAFTKASSSIATYYINGVFEGTTTFGNVGAGGQPFRIGWTGRASSDYFQGSIDDVRFYNTVLSPAAIQSLYLQG